MVTPKGAKTLLRSNNIEQRYWEIDGVDCQNVAKDTHVRSCVHPIFQDGSRPIRLGGFRHTIALLMLSGY